VRYLLLIYHNAAQRSSETEVAELVRQHAALHSELVDAGVLVSAAPLSEPAESITVKVRDGAPAVTDGPYLESKEHLAGYYLVDCSRERALEIAGRIPCGRDGAIEVRPVDEPVTRAVRGEDG
jgi:hypothetical protein